MTLFSTIRISGINITIVGYFRVTTTLTAPTSPPSGERVLRGMGRGEGGVTRPSLCDHVVGRVELPWSLRATDSGI